MIIERKVSGFDVYQLYVSLKLHFKNEGYDHFKYMGKIVAGDSFSKRQDQSYFYKLAKLYPDYDTVVNLFVANFSVDSEYWVGDFLSNIASERAVDRTSKHHALTYIFKNDIIHLFNSHIPNKENLKKDFDNIFVPREDQHPIIIQEYLWGEITIETVLLLNSAFNFLPRINKHTKDNRRWSKISHLLKKYEPFVPKKSKEEILNTVKTEMEYML